MDELIDIARFHRRLSEARTRTEESLSRLAGSRDTPVQQVVDELDDAWEELTIAEEELRQQSEEIASSRRALENERQRYFGLFQGAPDGYLVTDASGLVRDANERAVDLLGTRRATLVGKPLAVFVPEEQRQVFRTRLALLSRQPRVEDWEIELRPREGDALVVSVNVVAVPSRDAPPELRWQLRDVSEPHRLRAQLRMANEELETRVRVRTAELETAIAAREELLHREQELRVHAEAADRAKDDFLATLSHELRTPLTAMVGWVHLLSQGRLPPEDRPRAFQVIARSTQAQVKLIDEILDVSRILTGKLTLEREPLDLASVVAEAVESIRPSAEAKGVDLCCEPVADRLPIEGDHERLGQVMGNLLSNAVKFTPRGGSVAVRISSRADEVVVSVTDTGVGIPPEFLPQVFERFRQADSSSTRAHGGLGLGLAIVRYIVEQHGGSIEAASAGRGKGATFSFRLPQAMATAEYARPELEPQAAGGARPRVLIVEDDLDTREMLAVAMSQLGMAVASAGDAASALRVLAEDVPDVLVTDIGLPGEDGYTLLERVRQLPAERGGAVRVIALSGYPVVQGRTAAGHAFDEVIGKPVTPEDLAAAVRAVAARGPVA
jgi:PAS domain S-box-containing protein